MPNHHIVFVFLFNHSISSYSVKEKIEKYKKQVHQWHSVVHERLSPFEWSSIVSVSEIDKQYQQISSKLKLQFFNVAEEDTNQKLKLSILHELEQFTSILHTAPDDELTEWIQKLLNRISNYAAKNIRVAKALISEICLTIAKYCYKQFKNEWILDKPLNELLEEVDNLIDMEEARKYIETMLETLRQKKREETPSYSSMVKSILNYIYNHYNQDISLHTLSDRFQLSPGHISRLLRKETNSNFVEILTRTRLNAAKRLMRDPTKRIQEISEMTGFNNYVYFYQVFKRYEKLSPQEYKNRM